LCRDRRFGFLSQQFSSPVRDETNLKQFAAFQVSKHVLRTLLAALQTALRTQVILTSAKENGLTLKFN
jgi:hypothetical protein